MGENLISSVSIRLFHCTTGGIRHIVRTCIIVEDAGRAGIFLPDKEGFRGNPDGLQGKTMGYGGKRPLRQYSIAVNTGSKRYNQLIRPSWQTGRKRL
jgi:hypothetical protein